MAKLPLASLRLFPQTAAVPGHPAQWTPIRVKLFVVPAELSVADLHTAPERQFAVSLNGWVEYETSDGRGAPVRSQASIVLVEDTRGRGHITRFDDGRAVVPAHPGAR